jgi:hypothetical protein
MKRVFGCLTAALVLCAGVVSAEEAAGGGQGWSVLSGKTVGDGNNFLHGQVGWPGLSAGLLHGVSPTTDIGGRFTFDYGFEGVFGGSLVPNLKLQGLSRLSLLDTPKYNVGLEFNPGLGLYFFPGVDINTVFGTFSAGGTTRFGIVLPINLVVGIPVSSAIMASVGMDLNFVITFGDNAPLVMPLLFGGGFEYYIDQNMAVTFKLRLGPAIGISNSSTNFAANILAGLAIRL